MGAALVAVMPVSGTAAIELPVLDVPLPSEKLVPMSVNVPPMSTAIRKEFFDLDIIFPLGGV